MDVSKIIVSIFAFYLLIFCNFTKELVGCKLNYLLDTNIYYKHLVAFILLLFLIILIDEENLNNDIFYNIAYAVLIYLLFILSTRINYIIMLVLLIFLIIIFVLDKLEKKEQDNNKKDNYKFSKNIFIILTIILIVVGVTHYLITKYNEYDKNFSFVTFIFGNLTCKRT